MHLVPGVLAHKGANRPRDQALGRRRSRTLQHAQKRFKNPAVVHQTILDLRLPVSQLDDEPRGCRLNFPHNNQCDERLDVVHDVVQRRELALCWPVANGDRRKRPHCSSRTRIQTRRHARATLVTVGTNRTWGSCCCRIAGHRGGACRGGGGMHYIQHATGESRLCKNDSLSDGVLCRDGA